MSVTKTSVTKQETFDTVVRGILSQGGPAVDGNVCRYRTGGRKCAAGWLIPDDEYTTELEGPIAYVAGSLYEIICVRHGHDFDLVRALQRAHDHSVHSPSVDADFLVRFRAAAAQVAEALGLSTEVLQ